ncbi:Arabinanase/levansucrase/invertase [Dendrothele bispora CBS 962.96]|uniref:Arabinanase/levansucrase/invertase n=1 Tax=Dendrothele bispora (strain CBS 962.96) TaxID=1314807 RepID=A0A4S8L8L1_DENBC|nr:Arabinanase/levansucrase/invertase [Dendrothele bispora CBS 962.96]
MRVNLSPLSILAALAVRSVSAVILPNITARQSNTFSTPVIWEDLADLDIIRVGTDYYYSASTMHYSPGAPILHSVDLSHWVFIGHSVPTLSFGSNDYNLAGSHAYVRGIWASTLKHRPSNGEFIWLGCVDFSKTYVYNSPAITGPWSQVSVINNCYYDAGMLIDDDDAIYVAYGNTQISVAKLSADGKSQVSTQQVYSSTVGTIEGSRFYKKNGVYYILVTGPPSKEYVLKSTSGPFGPYTIRSLVLDLPSPIDGGSPHQGGLIDTPSGDWFYMAFVDAYPGGRMPTIAPVTWSSDGWPSVQLVNGGWGTSYVSPLPSQPLGTLQGTDTFTSLGPSWEWNHNPDTTAFQINNGLVLRTATVTNDLYAARNTLTHRILGPKSSGTILLDVTNMADGDQAGLAMFRDMSAWIGVKRSGSTKQIVMVNGLTMSGPNTTPSWQTTSTGQTIATASFTGNQVWFRATADIRPGGTNAATFSYSTDGTTFQNLGNTLTMKTDWTYFMGYRFGIFNFATKALGGSVTAKSFTLALA